MEENVAKFSEKMKELLALAKKKIGRASCRERV